MEQNAYLIRWKNLLVLPLIVTLLLISGCGYLKNPLKQIEIKTVEVERVIPTQNHPRPVSLNDIYFYVVTEENFEEFQICIDCLMLDTRFCPNL